MTIPYYTYTHESPQLHVQVKKKCGPVANLTTKNPPGFQIQGGAPLVINLFLNPIN